MPPRLAVTEREVEATRWLAAIEERWGRQTNIISKFAHSWRASCAAQQQSLGPFLRLSLSLRHAVSAALPVHRGVNFDLAGRFLSRLCSQHGDFPAARCLSIFRLSLAQEISAHIAPITQRVAELALWGQYLPRSGHSPPSLFLCLSRRRASECASDTNCTPVVEERQLEATAPAERCCCRRRWRPLCR